MLAIDLIDPTPDDLYEAFGEWATERGITLYPHQEEAAIELFDGSNVILATPTGSGKSLVAIAAHFAAVATGQRSYYTAPTKALVSEKFFATCEVFGAENVGMATGDAAVNSDAPIVCATAEILANIALREGEDAEIGQVVMDEFHYYADPQRGWAWQVPLLALPQAQFLLMSATLGDVSALAEDIARRTGRQTALVAAAERPVPLEFSWSLSPLHELLERLVDEDRAPVYVVHFTQAATLAQAQALTGAKLVDRAERDRIAEAIGSFRFTAGFGRTLSRLVRSGIGVHHAGMLPRYRRLVETLAQAGLLKVICGTDTLGVGINVPIRTVVMTGLAKYDGSRHRLLRAREFHQIAGRAGRAGFDTIGYVVVQAPEHAIENARRVAKAGDDPKKLKRVQKVKPEDGQIVWTEETFAKLRHADPEALTARLRINHATILNLIARRGDPDLALANLLEDNHQDERSKQRLAEQAQDLLGELLDSGVLERVVADEDGRTLVLAPSLQSDFALNQPLASFAQEIFDLLDPESETYSLDVVSVIEAILDDPFPVLMAQSKRAKTEAVATMKQEGIEYEERMEILEEISYPKPLEQDLRGALALHRETHPWISDADLSPKSVLRDIYESGQSFSEFVNFYGVARSEGTLLRYLTDAYRALRQTVPDRLKTDELDDLEAWLAEMIRQVDSSLLDEWAALTDPDAVNRAAAAVAAGEPLESERPISANERAFTVMVRNAMFQRVRLAARDDVTALAALEPDGPRAAVDWEPALGAYWEAYDELDDGPAARSPELFSVTRERERWQVRQIIADPHGNHDFAIVATVDLRESDVAGEPVIRSDFFGLQ